jgi:Single-strand binding protein family
MIKLQVIGNLGKDCIVKEVNGKNVINFSVAHTERYKDSQGNQKERTTWVECAYWTDRTAVQLLGDGNTAENPNPGSNQGNVSYNTNTARPVAPSAAPVSSGSDDLPF